MAKWEPKYIFYTKDGIKFDEFTEPGLHNAFDWPEEIKRNVTTCLLKNLGELGYAPKKGELEKYGITP